MSIQISTLLGSSLYGGTWWTGAQAARHTWPDHTRKDVMPPRSNPTLRQRRLGIELRRMRELAGLGGTQLGRAVGMSPAQVTQMESGRIGISADRLRVIAAACSCTNEAFIDALATIITERGRGWWEEYRGTLSDDFLDVAELEGHAQRLDLFTITFIPGLLQTGAYASAVFSRAFPTPARHEIDLRTAFRMQRQLTVRSGATPLTAFVHEAALRMQFSGPKVLVEQLGALVEDSQKPGISVRVVPFDIETLPGPSENFTYAHGPLPELDTVQMDTGHGSQIYNSPPKLGFFREILTHMGSVALSQDESRGFIERVKEETERKHG
ncbi:helix-turn-helix domain-containing protein [Kitasatospora sp. NPDC059747]|uniref:helix-turn-helix domain-containing protein n=1 Tax=Kitasatospora sp. NPDC059747 TaxID=3346930 RepID=UPI00364C54C7